MRKRWYGRVTTRRVAVGTGRRVVSAKPCPLAPNGSTASPTLKVRPSLVVFYGTAEVGRTRHGPPVLKGGRRRAVSAKDRCAITPRSRRHEPTSEVSAEADAPRPTTGTYAVGRDWWGTTKHWEHLAVRRIVRVSRRSVGKLSARPQLTGLRPADHPAGPATGGWGCAERWGSWSPLRLCCRSD